MKDHRAFIMAAYREGIALGRSLASIQRKRRGAAWFNRKRDTR